MDGSRAAAFLEVALHDETGIDRLVAAAKAGDNEAFGAIFDAYHDAVYRYVASRVGDFGDWDYSKPEGDAERAIYGNIEHGSRTALIPHGDDYLLICSGHGIDKMVGDIAAG
ncbi:MAG: hypothetical protein HGB05_19180, partial [Chloroflexi bacterium]|nr:hypothetical protein [Chloroflexota bacterium]